MAGKKFKSQGANGELALRCPRMAPKLYKKLRDRALDTLRQHFDSARVATEAPEKSDHGDVDILLCSPRGDLKSEHDLESMETQLAIALGATRSAYEHGILFITSPISPELIEDDSFSENSQASESYPPETTHPDPHVQYDLVLCSPPSAADWIEFRQAHGDMSNILQTGLQDAGFTFKPSGLHVRVPEIGAVQRKGRSIFLSNNPKQIMEFFGLSTEKYESQFESEKALFEWISSCSYFSRNQLAITTSNCGNNQPSLSSTNCRAGAGSYSSYLEYMADRAMFMRFRQVWLPDHPEIGAELLETRQEILERALCFFGAHTRYIVHLAAINAENEENKFWGQVHKVTLFVLGDKASKRKVTKLKEGLKRFVKFKARDGFAKAPVISSEPQMVTELQPKWTSAYEEGGFTESDLLNWIMDHWQEIFMLESERDRPRRLNTAARKTRERNKAIFHWLKVFFKVGAVGALALMLPVLFRMGSAGVRRFSEDLSLTRIFGGFPLIAAIQGRNG